MQKLLPEALRNRNATEKLIWHYIEEYPGEHSARSLDHALGTYAPRALLALVDAGLLECSKPARGNTPGNYRAIDPAQARAQAS